MKQEITLTPGGGPREHMPDTIQAETIGPFGIFTRPKNKRWWAQEGGWNVTHVPSGLMLCACASKEDAVQCCIEIMALPGAETVMARKDPLQGIGSPFRKAAARIVGKYRTW